MRDSLNSAPYVGGRYRVVRVLGEGGMGVVAEVADRGSSERLALKRLHHGAGALQASLFEREYRTLASLRHPRVVRVHEYGVDDDGPFYTMELLSGSDLAARAPMPWREVCACLRDAASILGLLHARELLHRDLTPRNLWQTPDGRLTLIDFGALTPFGATRQVIGTPAFVAPEVLNGGVLDQRTDLFALGALAYWLLTGTHAFRASDFSELHQLWQNAPAPPSSLARHVRGADHTIPRALDELVMSLLRIDPSERPHATSEVVSRLNALAGLEPEPEDVVVPGYLESSAFVGRRRERAGFSAALERAAGGVPQCVLIEGPEGSGRSRLLAECATMARLSGALVLEAEASPGGRPFHAALRIARGLLEALPLAARAASGEHAPVLADWAPELAARLGAEATPPPAPDVLSDRLRKQMALTSWLRAVARERTLVLLADDLERIDDESAGLLVTLVRDGDARILVLGACLEASQVTPPQSLRALAALAERLALTPLTEDDTRALLRSTFGDVPYLDRTSARLHGVSRGLPGHLLSLVRHLVAAGHARYAHGGWQLAAELPVDLPLSLREGLLASLASMSADASTLLAVTSLSEHSPLDPNTLASLLGWPLEDVERVASGLLSQRLLEASSEGLGLAHPALRDALLPALSETRRTVIHRQLAEHHGRGTDPADQVRAALHHLRAGQRRLAEGRLLAVARPMLGGALAYPRALAHMFEQALTLLRAAGASPDAEAALLAVLAMAAYQVDRSYAVRFGEDALSALERMLRFDLARRLRPRLGGLCALLVALLVAWLGGLRRGARVRVTEAATWLVTVLGYLMGPASMSLDRARLDRYANTFEPLLALGKRHLVHLAHTFCQGLILGIEDRASSAQRTMKGVMARLSSRERIRGLPAGNRRNMLAAAAYACGLREASACDPHVLQIADELTEGSPMHALQADLLRSVYYTYVGDLDQAETYEQRVERRAIQLGTAWQAELLGPRLQCRAAQWTWDYSRHKRGAHALARLAEDTPSFARSARWAAGTDLVLEGRFDQGIALLEGQDEPLRELGWVGVQATLAHAYNATGRYQQAKELCAHALAHLSPEDRDFVILYLPVEVERWHAEAGLGGGAEADAQLAALLAQHAHKGPLVLGYLHGARARIAALLNDTPAVERQLRALEGCYRTTQIPSLLAHCATLRDQLLRSARPSLTSGRPMAPDDRHLITRVGLIMGQDYGSRAGRADAALAVALDLSRAHGGFILYPETARPAAARGHAPSDEQLAWATAKLQTASAEEERTAELDDDAPAGDACEVRLGNEWQRLVVLWRRDGAVERPVAALCLSAREGPPQLPAASVLRVLGERLWDGGGTR